MKNSISLLLGAVVVLAVCQSSQAGAKREPKADLDECVAAARTSSLTFKREMASFMGVSQERMPALFCQRLADGVRSGRISYSDINYLQLDQPTEIWMVLKGKAKAAAPTQSQAPRSPNFRNCSGIAGAFQVPASQKCPASGYAQNSGIQWSSKASERRLARRRKTPDSVIAAVLMALSRFPFPRNAR